MGLLIRLTQKGHKKKLKNKKTEREEMTKRRREKGKEKRCRTHGADV